MSDSIAQPQVPQGLDPLLLHHWLWWQLLCADADGTAFQQLAEKVLRCVHPDFVPVKPYGNIGDRKNDGMLMGSCTVFQVYSPDASTQAQAIAKIKEDLPGAIEHWLARGLKRWVFVHNVRRGLPPDLVGLVLVGAAQDGERGDGVRHAAVLGPVPLPSYRARRRLRLSRQRAGGGLRLRWHGSVRTEDVGSEQVLDAPVSHAVIVTGDVQLPVATRDAHGPRVHPRAMVGDSDAPTR